jgi:hypothetical protein
MGQLLDITPGHGIFGLADFIGVNQLDKVFLFPFVLVELNEFVNVLSHLDCELQLVHTHFLDALVFTQHLDDLLTAVVRHVVLGDVEHFN